MREELGLKKKFKKKKAKAKKKEAAKKEKAAKPKKAASASTAGTLTKGAGTAGSLTKGSAGKRKKWTKLWVTKPKKPPWRIYICGTTSPDGTGKSLIVPGHHGRDQKEAGEGPPDQERGQRLEAASL